MLQGRGSEFVRFRANAHKDLLSKGKVVPVPEDQVK